MCVLQLIFCILCFTFHKYIILCSCILYIFFIFICIIFLFYFALSIIFFLVGLKIQHGLVKVINESFEFFPYIAPHSSECMLHNVVYICVFGIQYYR